MEFFDAWPARLMSPVEALSIPVLGREHLRANKLASGRPKDLQDLAMLDQDRTS